MSSKYIPVQSSHAVKNPALHTLGFLAVPLSLPVYFLLPLSQGCEPLGFQLYIGIAFLTPHLEESPCL